MKTLSTLFLLTWALICTSQEIRIIPKAPPNDIMLRMALSPSADFIAVQTLYGKQISIFETYSGREISRIAVPEPRPNDIRMLDDNTLLLVKGFSVECIDIPSKKLRHKMNNASVVVQSGFDPLQKTLALSSFDRLTILSISPDTIFEVSTMPSPPLYQMSLSEDGSVLSGLKDGRIHNWRTADLKLLGSVDATNIKSFEAASNFLISFRKDAPAYEFYHFNGEKRKGGKELEIPDPYQPRMQWTGDGFFLEVYKKIFHIDHNDNFLILETEDYFKDMIFDSLNARFITLGSHHLAITDMEGAEMARISIQQLAPADMYYHLGGEKNIIVLDSQVIFTKGEKNPRKQMFDGQYVPPAIQQGDRMYIALSDGRIQVWDILSEKKITEVQHARIPWKLVPAPDQKTLLVSDFIESAVYSYELSSGKGTRIHQDEAPVSSIETAGNQIYLGNILGTVKRTELINGKLSVRNRASIFGNGISAIRQVGKNILAASYGRMGFLRSDLSDSLNMELLVGHNGYINDLSVIQEGQFLLSSSNDKTIKLWDLQKKRLVQSYDLDSVSSTRLQPGGMGEFLFYGDGFAMGAVSDSVSIARSLKPATEIVVQSPNNNSPLKMAIDREGTLLASVDNNTVKVRDLRSGFLLSEFTTKTKIVNGICFTVDGKMLAVAAGDAIECFDPLTGKLVRQIDLEKRNRSLHDVEAYNNAIIGVNSFGWHVPLVLHKNSGLKIGEIWPTEGSGNDRWLRDFKSMPDASVIATYGSDYLKVYENKTKFKLLFSRRLSAEGKDHRGFIDYMQLSPDGKHLLYTDISSATTVNIVEIPGGNEVKKHPGGPGAIGRDGQYMYVQGKNRLRMSNISVDSSRLLDLVFDGQINNIIYNETSDIFAVSDNWGNIRILEGRTGSLLKDISRWDQYTYTAQLSADGRYVLFNNRWGLYTVDLNTLQRDSIPAENYPLSGVFSPASDKLYFRKGQEFQVKTLSSGKIDSLFTIPGEHEVNRVGLSEDGKVLFYGTEKNDLVLVNLETGQSFFSMNRFVVKNWDGFVLRKVIPLDGRYQLQGVGIKNHGKESGMTLINMNADESMAFRARGQELRLLREGDGFEQAVFERDARIFDASPDGRYISLMKNLELYIIDKTSNDTIFNRDNPISGNIEAGFFTPDNKQFVIGFDDGYVEVYDLTKKGKQYDYGREGSGLERTHRFRANPSGVSFLQLTGGKLLAKGNDAFISLFDASKNFSRQLDMDFIRDEDQVFVNGEGYYYSTKNALNYIAFRRDVTIFPFEQLDLRFNRPDKVLESAGSSDKALVNSFRMAHQKRLKKFNVTETSQADLLNVPEAEIRNRKELPIDQSSPSVQIQFSARDEKSKLKTLQVWVNNVPLWGLKGLSLESRKSKSLDTTLTIELGTGSNKIELAVTNMDGAESFRTPLLVNYSPKQRVSERVYFTGIGIDRFANSQYNLRYSTKDIRDLVAKLRERYGDALVVDTLFNENVTAPKVKALKKRLQETTVNDKVIVSYSGHGLLSKDFDYYLSTYSIDFDQPEKNGLAYDELESLLDGIPARKKLLLIDACHSGEVDKEDLVAMEAVTSNVIKGFKPVAYKKQGQLGLKSSFELMQSLFVDVGNSTGATIISAAAGTQFALEGINNLPNGVFTHSILESLKSPSPIRISVLKKSVGDRVEQITQGMQKPTSRSEKVMVDWEL